MHGEVGPKLRALAFVIAGLAFISWLVTGGRDATDQAAYARRGAERAAAAKLGEVTRKQIDALFALMERERARSSFVIAPVEPLVRGSFTIDARGPTKIAATDPVLQDSIARELAAKVDAQTSAKLAWHAVLFEAAPTLMAWEVDRGFVRGFVIDNPAWTAEIAKEAGDAAVLTVQLDGHPALFANMSPSIGLHAEPNPIAVARANDDGRAVLRSFAWQAALGSLLVILVALAGIHAVRRDRAPKIPEASLATADAVVDRVLARVNEAPRAPNKSRPAAARKSTGKKPRERGSAKKSKKRR